MENSDIKNKNVKKINDDTESKVKEKTAKIAKAKVSTGGLSKQKEISKVANVSKSGELVKKSATKVQTRKTTSSVKKVSASAKVIAQKTNADVFSDNVKPKVTVNSNKAKTLNKIEILEKKVGAKAYAHEQIADSVAKKKIIADGEKNNTKKVPSKASGKALNNKDKIVKEKIKTSGEKNGQIGRKKETTVVKKQDETKVKAPVKKSTVSSNSSKIIVPMPKKVKEEKVEEYKKGIDINFIDDELNEKFDIKKLDEELKIRNYIPKEERISIFKNSFYNLILAGVFSLFLIFCSYGFFHIEKNTMIKNANLFSFLFLGVSIMLFEKSYKEKKIKKCINGIEVLIMGIFTLLIPYTVQIYTSDFIKVLIIFGVVTWIYYIIKSVIALFINKGIYLRSKDDIAKEKDDSDPELEDEDIEE